MELLKGPWKVQSRFLISFGCLCGVIRDIIFENKALGTVFVRPMFSVPFWDLFLMASGYSREPQLKFMQPSLKIKVRRNCDQGGFGMLPGSIFHGFWSPFGRPWHLFSHFEGLQKELKKHVTKKSPDVGEETPSGNPPPPPSRQSLLGTPFRA